MRPGSGAIRRRDAASRPWLPFYILVGRPILAAGRLSAGSGPAESGSVGWIAQCRLVFPPPNTCINCGADPLVRGRPPGRPPAFGRKLIPNEERVRGDPRGPGGPPHNLCSAPSFLKTKWHWAIQPADSLSASP